MKKIICIIAALLIIGLPSFAQNKDAKKPAAAKQTPAKTTAPAAAKTKKDGSPDMRYKANKEAAKPAPKLKKDGTPDKRYKENKTPAKKDAGAKKK